MWRKRTLKNTFSSNFVHFSALPKSQLLFVLVFHSIYVQNVPSKLKTFDNTYILRASYSLNNKLRLIRCSGKLDFSYMVQYYTHKNQNITNPTTSRDNQCHI